MNILMNIFLTIYFYYLNNKKRFFSKSSYRCSALFLFVNNHIWAKTSPVNVSVWGLFPQPVIQELFICCKQLFSTLSQLYVPGLKNRFETFQKK